MEYKKLKSKLKNFTKIYITGPQRSGTRIASKIISYDLNLKYMQEERIDVDDKERFNNFKERQNNFVLQCPGMSAFMDEYDFNDQEVVIFMRREINDIINSQKRINWPSELEIVKYNNKFKKFEDLNTEFTKDTPISNVKYSVWDFYQKTKLEEDRFYDLEYSSLSDHELFLPKKKRENFDWDQTEL